MRKFIALTQIIALVTISWLPVLAQPTQGRKVGNITGLITAKKQKDENQKETGDTSLLVNLNSDVPIDKMKVEIPNYNPALKEQIKTPILPLNWTAIKDEAGFFLNGPARFDLKFRIDIHKDNADVFDEYIRKNPVTLDFSFSEYKYGSRDFKVDFVEPTTPVTPDQAADFPPFVRIGDYFFFTPKEGYTDGKWQFKIGGQKLTEIGANLPENIDPPKFEKLTAEQKNAVKKMIDLFQDSELKIHPGELQLVTTQVEPPSYNPAPVGVKVFEEKTVTGETGTKVLIGSNNLSATYTNEFGEKTVTGETGTKVLPDNSRETAGLPPRLINCTPKLFPGDKVCVCGFFPWFYYEYLLFDGKPDRRHLSGSTDIATFLVDDLAPGKHTITWNTNALLRPTGFAGQPPSPPSPDEKVEFVVLDVKPSIVKQVLETGEKTYLEIEIFGTDEALPIRLTNKTPNIIQLEGEVSQVAMTSGGIPNKLKRDVIAGNLEGKFDIEYVLDLPPCPCNPVKDAATAKTETVTKPTETTTKPPDNPSDTATDDDSVEEIDCGVYLLILSGQSTLLENMKKEYIQGLEKCNKDLSFLPDSINRHKFREECRAALDSFYPKRIDYYEGRVTEAYLLYLLCKEKPKKNPQ